MTPKWLPEGVDRDRVCEELKRRQPQVATLLGDSDGAYYFHLESMYRLGKVVECVQAVAMATDNERRVINCALFRIQQDVHYFRSRSIRPFTLLFTELILRSDWWSKKGLSLDDPGPMVKDAADLRGRLEKKLFSVGLKRTARTRSIALVALAESCVRLRWEIATMAESDGPPIPELWRVLIAAERVGWWSDEILPWLHPLAIRLIDQEEDEKED